MFGPSGVFHRADAPIVRVMHVAHLKAGAVAAETAGTEGGEAALMGQFRQWIGLIHELRELRAAEELAHGSDDRANVNQRVRRCSFRVLQRHTLFDHPLHAQETDAELLLDQFADGSHTAVAEVINIIGAQTGGVIVQLNDPLDNLENVVGPQHAHFQIRRLTAHFGSGILLPQVLVQFVAPNP